MRCPLGTCVCVSPRGPWPLAVGAPQRTRPVRRGARPGRSDAASVRRRPRSRGVRRVRPPRRRLSGVPPRRSLLRRCRAPRRSPLPVPAAAGVASPRQPDGPRSRGSSRGSPACVRTPTAPPLRAARSLGRRDRHLPARARLTRLHAARGRPPAGRPASGPDRQVAAPPGVRGRGRPVCPRGGPFNPLSACMSANPS